MKLFRLYLILTALFILPLVFSKPAYAVTFTIDTVDTRTYNPVTTPTLNWTASSSNLLIMSGAATPDATVSAKLDGGTNGISQKTGFGLPTNRWSISFENVKTGLYNVTLLSELKTITFKINVTNTYYSAGVTVTPTKAPMEQLVTGDSDITFMLLGAGVLFLLFSFVTLKRSWQS